MKGSRREFLQKAGKTIITGAGWTAISLFGLSSAGCERYGLCGGYCTGCTSYCENCTGCTGCTRSCTSSCTTTCTSGTTGGNIQTKTQLLLNGWGFTDTAIYHIIASSGSQSVSRYTDDYTLGQWYNSHEFQGNITIEHKSNEEVTVEIKRDLISDPKVTERVSKTFTTSYISYNLTFDWFPVGVYFSVKSNITNTPVGTVNVTIKDQGGSLIISDITDTGGIAKYYVADPINTYYPLKSGTPYTAYFNREGFKEAIQSFTIQSDSYGISGSSAFVVYMIPTA
ncbi:MAG TPA: hypothetical protein PL110_06890 [Candidatus Eremiobacteraeota bacterium]|nr:MAG: hypothetical protein BWY64_03358 [bacterium ADurb.Bin363]HPZ07820.1 hypothetical protein [Candidatus Eremiobacteraeota bacterium]